MNNRLVCQQMLNTGILRMQNITKNGTHGSHISVSNRLTRGCATHAISVRNGTTKKDIVCTERRAITNTTFTSSCFLEKAGNNIPVTDELII